MTLTKTIHYCAAPYGFITNIPAGTEVTRAVNLPGCDHYWVKEWPNMEPRAVAWHRNYGFLVTITELDNEE